MSVQAFLSSIDTELVALRRELHQIPEVGLDLPQTQARLLEELAGLGLEITTGESLTSIVAVLRGGVPTRGEGQRPVVLLRGDMDGLPVEELTGLDFASSNGNMHACGHDLHMTMLVGAARALGSLRDELAGDVVFMFQPGEEQRDGAGHMLREGVLEAAGPRPVAAYAIHVWSAREPGGQFSTKPGTVMASSDTVTVTVEGRGGHGSAPHLAADPVPALAEMITATHAMVTRRFDIFDPVVVTVGVVRAGSSANVIAEQASLSATVRAFTRQTRERVLAALQETVAAIAAAHGVTARCDHTPLYPSTVNDDEQADIVADVASDLFGADRHVRWDHPLGASEDFSRVLLEVPGCFIGLSACPPDADPASAPYNHSAHARFDDSVCVDGAALLAELARRRLA